MKALIMAAGSYRTFDRKAITISGETLIDRIVRQLQERSVTEIYISGSYIGQHNDIIGAEEIVNTMTGKDLGCLYGLKDFSCDIYLYADVFYSHTAMDLIFSNNTTYFGRSTPSPLKSYGEFFAFKHDPEMWKWLEVCWLALQNKKIDRLWSWDLYAFHTKKWSISECPIPRKKLKREQYLILDNFTEINDWTDDFDSQQELDKWLTFYRGMHD